MSQIVDISLSEISCVFQMFTFVTSCCSPAFPPQYKRAPVFALYGMEVGVYRMLLSECFRVLCPSTVSKFRLEWNSPRTLHPIEDVVGKMIICPSMNINLLFVGGTSIFAKFLS